MLLNISYNDPTVKRKIVKAVGRPFSLQQRWKLGGIGSQKLVINSASIDIHNLLILDNNLKSCNLELRPLGIIVHFRSLLETYGLIIPYYKLKIYKGKAKEYSLYIDQHYIKIFVDSEKNHAFFKKVGSQKSLQVPPSLEGL
jgi:rRNA processing protein Krr1/Pno1